MTLQGLHNTITPERKGSSKNLRSQCAPTIAARVKKNSQESQSKGLIGTACDWVICVVLGAVILNIVEVTGAALHGVLCNSTGLPVDSMAAPEPIDDGAQQEEQKRAANETTHVSSGHQRARHGESAAGIELRHMKSHTADTCQNPAA